jgi:hypothetical protein
MLLPPLWLLLLLCSWLASVSSATLWTYGSAFVVLVGVVGETVTELTDWVKPEARKKKLQTISAIVLIVGLTGDLIGIHETQLEVAYLTKEAGDAKTSADSAALAASRAKASADAASITAGEAQQKADKAMASALNALGLASAARGEAVSAIKQLATERAKHAPRDVTPKQAACVKDALKGVGANFIKVWAWHSPPEAKNFAFKIAGAFETALKDEGGGIHFDWQKAEPTASGIIMSGGGTKEFAHAMGVAMSCIEPGISPPVSDPSREIDLYVFPEPYRSEK